MIPLAGIAHALRAKALAGDVDLPRNETAQHAVLLDAKRPTPSIGGVVRTMRDATGDEECIWIGIGVGERNRWAPPFFSIFESISCFIQPDTAPPVRCKLTRVRNTSAVERFLTSTTTTKAAG